MRHVWSLLLTLVLAVTSVGQELRVPVMGEAPAAPTNELPESRVLKTMAEAALATGLSGTAAEFFARSLALPNVEPGERAESALGLALAHLERNRPEDALLALNLVPESSRRELRVALAAFLRNDLPTAFAGARRVDSTSLPTEERPWALLLQAIADTSEGRDDAALKLTRAFEAATGESQRQRLELLGARALLQAGRQDDATLASLEQQVREAGPGEAGFAFARLQAAVLARRGNTQAATNVLLSTAGDHPARRAEAELIAGLILGADSDAGATLLRSAAAALNAPSALRARAIRSLATAATEVPPGRVVQTANAAYAFLSDSQRGCPRSPEVLDTIHLARAQVMLAAGNRELARAAAEDLLRETPASRLAPEAVRLLAAVAWNEGSYRLAAGHLEKLTELADPRDRDTLKLAIADCLFLAGDAALAERAYANLQMTTPDLAIRELAFHQAILSALKISGGIELAAARIEAAANLANVSQNRLLAGAWNTAETSRRSGDAQVFARTLARLTRVTEGAPLTYQLRFEWLRALSALANGDRTTASRTAESLLNRLTNLPADAAPELLEAAPELRAHAALLRARSGPHAQTSVEIEALAQLRERFGKASASAAATLAEGRLLAGEGRHREAQTRFEELTARFADDPALADYAALGLHEAAEQAILLAPTLGQIKFSEAARLLGALRERFPTHALVYRATLRQAEVFRRLGDFDSALRTLDDLVRLKPDHPERARAELTRADCLMGLASLRRSPTGTPDRLRINRALAAYERTAAIWAKQPDILAEARHKQAQTLLERARGEAAADAEISRREARQLLAAEAADLVQGSRDTLGVEGRVWVARSLLLLGEACEAQGDRQEALAAYRLLRDLNAGLPEGAARLPGRAAAESKLAELEGAPSNLNSR